MPAGIVERLLRDPDERLSPAAIKAGFGKDVQAVHSEDAKDTPSRASVRSAASTPR